MDEGQAWSLRDGKRVLRLTGLGIPTVGKGTRVG